MADVRAGVGFDEVEPIALTFPFDGTITFNGNRYDLSNGSAQTSKAVALVSDSTIGLGASGGYPLGKLLKVEKDVASVQVSGSMSLPYNPAGGTPPIVGRGVVVDGTGLVISPAGGVRTAGERGVVLHLDAVAQLAYVYLP